MEGRVLGGSMRRPGDNGQPQDDAKSRSADSGGDLTKKAGAWEVGADCTAQEDEAEGYRYSFSSCGGGKVSASKAKAKTTHTLSKTNKVVEEEEEE